MGKDSTGRGVLFANRQKNSDDQPDFTGSMSVLGKKYKITACRIYSQDQELYLSLNFQEDSTITDPWEGL